MKCSDARQVLPEFLDGAPAGVFPADFESHLKSCPDCSDLVSDLKLISSEARQMAATEEPAPRVWARIAAQLRAEGLIREPESTLKSAPIRPILVPTSPRRRWSAWWLAPVAAALLAAGSYLVSHKPAPQQAKQQAPAPPVSSPTPPPVQETAALNSAPASAAAPHSLAQRLAGSKDTAETRVPRGVEPAPNEDDQQFLSMVSTRAPSMRATYENQLQAVNTDIRESQAYLDQNPGDADARQHLMDAYQQKALLYQIALDRIQ